MKKQLLTLWAVFLIVMIVQGGLWFSVRKVQAEWLNVPPLPSDSAVEAAAFGDRQLAYRSIGIMLQNLGDTGGRVTALRDYNYDMLTKWLYLTSRLDRESSYTPYIAAYYFGGLSDTTEKLRPLVKYLHNIGNSPEGEKWRWLAHAVYLARYRVEDMDMAHKMAVDLAALANRPDSEMPNWARQMPAFILNQQGEKEAALIIMLEILSSVGDKLHPNEVNHTRGYICENILSPEEAKKTDLCDGDF